MAISILVVEDDKLFNETLCDFLEECGYETVGVKDARSAIEKSYYNRFDIYIFDINLPFESGLTLLKSLRESGDTTPAIMLTSRDDKASLIEGFSLGADDYLKKPVDLDELELRIKALLNRVCGGINRYEVGNCIVDVSNHKVICDGKSIELGRKVFELLLLLLKANGKVVPLETIINRLWSRAEESSYGAVRVYITKLKKIFGDRIENIRGVGYRLIQ